LEHEVQRLTNQINNLLKPSREQAVARAERLEAEIKRLVAQQADLHELMRSRTRKLRNALTAVNQGVKDGWLPKDVDQLIQDALKDTDPT
jgi:hypothetical protein